MVKTGPKGLLLEVFCVCFLIRTALSSDHCDTTESELFTREIAIDPKSNI